MYKEARLAGVPLKLELASAVVQQRFKLAPATLKAFNLYLAACPTEAKTLTAIMREQAILQMQWRLLRRAGGETPLEAKLSFQRASTFDKNDLHSANLEFEQEITAYNQWLKDEGVAFKPSEQKSGFGNTHKSEWEEIAAWWNKPPVPATAIMDFFDNYVHDSRAWFKFSPAGTYPDNEADMIINLKKWEKKRVDVAQMNAVEKEKYDKLVRRLPNGLNSGKYVAATDGLTEGQRAAAAEYARTGQLPRMITAGREPFEAAILEAMAGYLRFRKIYGGWDALLLSDQASEHDAVARSA